MSSKPLVMSRACIQDTLLAKRQARECLKGHAKRQTGKKQGGFDESHPREGLGGIARAIYNFNVKELRRGQLAAHVETRLLPNRYLDMQAQKRVAPDIVITIRGGLVQEVRSTNPYTTVYIADYDLDSPEENAATEDAEERGMWSDMHIVY